MQNTILFIDDEPSVLEALEWTFADEPYRCITCQDPFHALEIMSETDVAVVVSDQRMPGMNGADFLAEVKSRWPETERIMMTAYQELDIALMAINMGRVSNLIYKPWEEAELRRVIRTAVEDYTLRVSMKQQSAVLTGRNEALQRNNQSLAKMLRHVEKMASLDNLVLQLTVNEKKFHDKSISEEAIFDHFTMLTKTSN
ncbi:MAG TPA: hypothetical protein DDX81_10525 [Desulfofustis sp.]|jgi:DNA-binding NtrC family response regulator|nr:response regulator [Desulfofustis sp. PB-SRB1]HBH32314.1 hypothetical protein [Desulfofustis sp.]